MKSWQQGFVHMVVNHKYGVMVAASKSLSNLRLAALSAEGKDLSSMR